MPSSKPTNNDGLYGGDCIAGNRPNTLPADLEQTRLNITRELNHLTTLYTEGNMPGNAMSEVQNARSLIYGVIGALDAAESDCRNRVVRRERGGQRIV